MSGAVFSRRAFLARSAMLVGALAGIKAFAPGEAAESATAASAHWESTTLRSPASMVEWWVESMNKEPATIDVMCGDTVVYSHVVPPKSGIYVQFPLGRQPEFDHFRINDAVIDMGRVSCHRVILNPERPAIVQVKASSTNGDFMFGAMWEE